MSRLDHAALKTALSEAVREGWTASERETRLAHPPLTQEPSCRTM